MGNDQPALRTLFACESGLSEPEIGLEHAFVLLIWQMKHDKWVKWQNSHGARFGKTTANCSNSFRHFHLILSVSRPQRPLITILLYVVLNLITAHIKFVVFCVRGVECQKAGKASLFR
jgi:hypothetical protein